MNLLDYFYINSNSYNQEKNLDIYFKLNSKYDALFTFGNYSLHIINNQGNELCHSKSSLNSSAMNFKCNISKSNKSIIYLYLEDKKLNNIILFPRHFYDSINFSKKFIINKNDFLRINPFIVKTNGYYVFIYFYADYILAPSGNYSKSSVEISASSNLNISSCRLNWNGTYENMSFNANSCSIIKSVQNNTNYTYFVELNVSKFDPNLNKTLNFSKKLDIKKIHVEILNINLTYVYPTPLDMANRYVEKTLNLAFSSSNNNCGFNINGENLNASYNSLNQICYINYSIADFNGTNKNITFYGYINNSGSIIQLDTRNIKIYYNLFNKSLPMTSNISIILMIFIMGILGYFSKRKVKNKKALSEIVAVMLILVVTVVASVGFYGWYHGYENKLTQNIEFYDSVPAEILKVSTVLNSTDLNLFIANRNPNYQYIKNIKINSKLCQIIKDNIVKPNDIGSILISNCSYKKKLPNEIVILTQSGVYSKYTIIK